MQAELKNRLYDRILFLSYFIGIVLCVATQLVVAMQHGPKLYVSLLWAFLYPSQLFIAESCARAAVALHISLRNATAIAVSIAITSALFGLIFPALVGLTRSSNRFARYVGIVAVGIIALITILWGPFPDGL